MARIAKALDVLRSQINAQYPNRSKVSDGWIGDLAHQATPSDHNPGADGVVEALDITHDLANGVDTWTMAETLRQNRDSRIKYVISNGRAFVGNHGTWNGRHVGAWTWFKYTGKNAHAHHIHVSVLGTPDIYDRADPWNLKAPGSISSAPPPPKPAGVTEAMRQRMLKVIMGYEGKIPPQVFIAPDGRPEIAGITQKDHPQQFAVLKRLLDTGKASELTAAVIAYYDTYTDPAQNWTGQAGIEFFLRDCVLNRGLTGAAEIVQDAVGVEIDGQVGPTTRGALAALPPDIAIDKLRAARERYEDRKYPHRRTSGQWQGMISRWNKAQAQAKEFQRQQQSNTHEITAVIVTTTGTLGGTAAIKKTQWTWGDLFMVGFIALVAALVVVMIIRKLRNK